MPDRCPTCDRPLATDEDCRTIPPGKGKHLCWATGVCSGVPVNWRARYMEAEAEIDRLRQEIGEAQRERQTCAEGLVIPDELTLLEGVRALKRQLTLAAGLLPVPALAAERVLAKFPSLRAQLAAQWREGVAEEAVPDPEPAQDPCDTCGVRGTGIFCRGCKDVAPAPAPASTPTINDEELERR